MYALSLALLSAVLFGASTPASKLLLGALEPFQLAGLLYLGAALGMAPVVLIERRRAPRMVLDRRNALRLGGAVGERPKGSVTETTDVVAVVESVDRKNRIVTLKGPEATVTLKVADDVNLANVNAGDEVVARYVSHFAIQVEPAPKVSGTVEIESTGIALGVGVQWGHGTMTMYDGSVHKFKVGGLSLVDLGISKARLSGEVYRLMDPKDFAGTYATGAAGATLGKGAAVVALKNGNGVVMQLKSKSKGVRLSLATAGLNVELVD